MIPLIFSGSALAAVPLKVLDLALMEQGNDVTLSSLQVNGLKHLDARFFREKLFNLEPGNEYKILEIRKAISSLKNGGYFDAVKVSVTGTEGKLDMRLDLTEQPLLTNIKIGGDYLSDLEALDKIFAGRDIIIGKIFNEVIVRSALQEYREYLQSKGKFLFQIKYRSKQNVGFSDKWFHSVFRIHNTKRDYPIYLKLYFFKINYFEIATIRVIGNKKISSKSIIKQLGIQRGEMIRDNSPLRLALWKLNRLGVFSYVFIDIRPEGMLQKAELIIRVKEIESSILNTSLSLNSREDFDLELDYFNYSIGEDLARFSSGAVFDFKKESVDYVFLLSFPRLLGSSFLNLQFKRHSFYDPFVEGWEKLTEVVSFDVTFGQMLSRHFSLYNSISYLYTSYSYLGSGTRPSGAVEEFFHGTTGKLFVMTDSLDDNFYPTRGVRTILSLELPLVSEFDFYLIVDHKLEIYVPLQWNLTFAFYEHSAFAFTDGSRISLTLEERRKTTAQDRLAETLEQMKMAVYSCIEFRWRLLSQFAFVFFGEAGGAWENIGDFQPLDMQYGIGIGFRVAPRQHYYAHIFKYPWSVNFGFNISSRGKDDLSYSIVSSRDEYYYINLQASF